MSGVTSTVRLATIADARDCLAIYAPIVEETPISFEVEVPSLDEFERRMSHTLETWPWLVAEDPERGIVGYAYAGRHRGRAAYQWCVEVSAYVRSDQRRGGLGRRLYETLFACLRAQGFYNAYAGIVIPNDPSIGLHRDLGFSEIGVYEDVGYKEQAWRSVSWWHLRLQPQHEGSPSIPRALPECRDAVDRAIAAESRD